MILGSNSADIGIYPLQLVSFCYRLRGKINPKSEARNPKQIRNPNFLMFKTKYSGLPRIGFGHSNFENLKLFRISNLDIRILSHTFGNSASSYFSYYDGHCYSHRAASTMVSTSLSVKWCTAAALVGQATAQAPQPLQSTSWICETWTPSPTSTSSGAP